MDNQYIVNEYKEDLRSNLHQELSNKIGKRNSFVSNKKNIFEKNKLTFENFFNEIAVENQEYIIYFPSFLQLTKNIQIEFFLEKSNQAIHFIHNLIKYAIIIDEEFQYISEPALISLSKILKSNSVQIIDLVLSTKVELNGEVTTFCEQLPMMTNELKTEDQLRALLRCIAVIVTVIPQLEVFFIDFFKKQLSDLEHRSLLKTASSSACQIICNNPDSDFSEEIVGSLPLDIQDPELSKYLFKSLIARCNNGNCYCFDIRQMIDLTCNCHGQISLDAANLLITASLKSPIICEYLLKSIPFDKLLQNVGNSKCICLLISSIIKQETTFANSFIPLIDNLLKLYYESILSDKVYIIEAICSIISNSDIGLIDNLDSVYEVLLEGVYLDDDVIIDIINTLHYMNYTGEDFRQILLNLSVSNDIETAFHASFILYQIDQN